MAAMLVLGAAPAFAERLPETTTATTPRSAADYRALLSPAPPPAGSTRLLGGSAEAYHAARRALARGEAAAALEALESSTSRILSDRESLARADALLALGEVRLAQRSYVRALEGAVIPVVARAAARGLAKTHGELGRPSEALAILEALGSGASAGRAAQLELAAARIHADRGARRLAMELAVRLRVEHPTTRAAREAEALIEKLAKAGTRRPALTLEDRIQRARGLVAGASVAAAAKAVAKLPKTHPETRYLAARLEERRGRAEVAEKTYEALGREVSRASVAAEALGRLARRRLRADDNDAAQAFYDRVAGLVPGTREAIAAEYMAAWIPYDTGRYEEARTRMLRFAGRHRRANNRDEALWYAGWASYLEGSAEAARLAWSKLLSEHSRSSLVPAVHYWLGRLAEREKATKKAVERYQSVLAVAPLGYYGLWASRRLEDLGQKRPPLRSPGPAGVDPGSVPAALSALGPKRPISVDRAVLLEKAGRPGEALDELASSRGALLDLGSRARPHVAALLHALGAHQLGFRMARTLTSSGKELESGGERAWRAWRFAYPRAFVPFVEAARKAHTVRKELVWAIMRTESHYAPLARSRVGARGLMQLMPGTARQIGIETADVGGRRHAARYGEPASNIWLGTWYLSALLERYGGQLVPAVGAYNGGPRNMDRWLAAYGGLPLDEFVERIPYRETRRYVRRVVETWSIYRQLYGGARPKLPDTITSSVANAGTAGF